MGKKLQLHIPLPCHEDWNNMTPVEKGKFCASCQKAVIDFTDMSDEQVITFFKKPSTGSVCGRFQENQLNRNMQMPRKTLPWIKYFFQFTLPAFLISMKADAQRQKTGKIASVCVSEIQGNIISKVIPEIISVPTAIKGKVIDENGLPVVGATIMIKGTHHGGTADRDGNFSIVAEPSNYFTTLVISSIGFQSIEKTFDIREYTDEKIITMRLRAQSLGEVVVAGMTALKGKVAVFDSARIVTCTKRSLKDSLINSFIKNLKDSTIVSSKRFSIYPNPVSTGQTIAIANNKLPDDNYDVEIISLAGQVVHKEQMTISGKQKINLQTPFVAAGTYFLKLTGEKTLKTYSEKIIVQ